ncbi:hypothetical protein D6D15_03493 [Aureobasidium pullulans]|uniref:Protein kinase domain-containing protein n=1 Tax=Aureobasidium pullulans TaxID=5580 RepID=A0A4S9BF86_AURPU|nr:hypothetical protein D6D15_03493 [Aureobasidium pullulans]
MAAKPPAKGYWQALPEFIQALVADSFHNFVFTGPPNQTIDRPIPVSTDNTRWVPVPRASTKKGFAEGSEGLINLWCLLDSDDKIIDRIIIKQIHPGCQRYEDSSNWKDGNVGGEPRECAMTNSVWSALATDNRKHVLECLGYGDCKGEPRWRYRLYFEFSEREDLSRMIEAQREGQSSTGQKRKADDGDTLFPEAFLWYLLESLAKVVVAMDQAGDKGGVLHGDLQAANIFFSAPDSKRFSLYPIPKVADFGSSRNLGDSGVRDRSDVVRRDACCMLFAPPELARINDGVTWEVKDGPSATLSNKTNVWQVGMLLACCMRLRPYLPKTDWRDVPQMHWETPEKEQLRFGKKRGRPELSRKQLCHENSKYNSVLINIVKLCLHFDPVKRPSPSSLLRGVQKYMKDAVAGVENYQSVEGEADDDIQPYKLLKKKDDRYKIGKQFD